MFDIDAYRKRVDAILEQALPKKDTVLDQAIRYAVLQGGKRFRPLLVYAMGLSVNANLTELDYLAMAVEIIHAYSLVHDDLPAMDNDLLRRGLPTCHVAYGEAIAILTGDAMQALAFEVLAKCPHSNTLQMIVHLAKACGSSGMAGGQAQDLSVVGLTIDEAKLVEIHREKTGELIKASLLLGAMASPDSQTIDLMRLTDLGLMLGLAYQIQDDIFDVELPTECRGKEQGADAKLNKPTYPAIVGLAQSKQRLYDLTQKIDVLLAELNLLNSPLANLIACIFNRLI